MKRCLFALWLLLMSAPLFSHEKEGGIIGTGVVGQITSLDQFEVSGMRFNLPSDIEITGVQSVDALRMGMTLVLNTARDGSGWQATQIRRVSTISGPKTGPNDVMGVPIIGALPDAPFVTVDGFWSKDGIVASHISVAAAGEHFVTGVFEAEGQTVGTVALRDASLALPPDGDVVTAFGIFDNGTLRAERFETDLFMGDAPDLLLIEGFFSTPDENNEIALNGFAVSTMEAEATLDMTQQVRRCAWRGRLDYQQEGLSDAEATTIQDFCVSASPKP